MSFYTHRDGFIFILPRFINHVNMDSTNDYFRRQYHFQRGRVMFLSHDGRKVMCSTKSCRGAFSRLSLQGVTQSCDGDVYIAG